MLGIIEISGRQYKTNEGWSEFALAFWREGSTSRQPGGNVPYLLVSWGGGVIYRDEPDQQSITVLYCRVLTPDQRLDRQREETWIYATERLNVKPAHIEVCEDTGTGRDVQRKGFQDLMECVRDGAIERVVVLELSRLSRSMRDLAATLDELGKQDTGLHVIDRSLAIEPDDSDPMTEAFFYLAGVFAQLEADLIRERTISGIRAAREQGKWTGRPPYGFSTGDEGYLVLNDNYDRAIAILDELEADASVRSLARQFGIARSTVRNVRENAEWYREQGQDEY